MKTYHVDLGIAKIDFFVGQEIVYHITGLDNDYQNIEQIYEDYEVTIKVVDIMYFVSLEIQNSEGFEISVEKIRDKREAKKGVLEFEGEYNKAIKMIEYLHKNQEQIRDKIVERMLK